ncbi:MAG: N(4)-(beta-N-acetylglucosaminyl)-L-asparaginase [Planctomycetales bacterium]|nr:N(4)-(beta-N-acetylglucosaminyl)-L-asparaginase [Planctomycetales bacterium]
MNQNSDHLFSASTFPPEGTGQWTRRGILAAGSWFAMRSTLTGSHSVSAAELEGGRPRFVSTWAFGKPANDVALAAVQQGKPLLDAIELGVHVVEQDASNDSVGLGGIPNAAGVVQLDACVMDGIGHRAGAVAALEQTLHPVSVARRVMERTRHVMLVGEGARQFAREQGFGEHELLTSEQRRKYEDWKTQQSRRDAGASVPGNHDTIALLGIDADGNLAGACSTSGWGYKVPGRVGDSPIIGSGLYVDNEVGGAGATGIGENVMRYCASFMIVEFMRQGMLPGEACAAMIRRIAAHDLKPLAELHINFVAMDKFGRVGAAGTSKEFQYSVADVNASEVASPLIIE